MDNTELLIHKRFQEVARRFADKTALQAKINNQFHKLSYGDLERESLKIAASLRAAGFTPGDFAALILENRMEWPVIYLGVMFAGMACVPLDTQLSTEEISNLVSDSGAKVLFCSDEVFAKKITPAIRSRLEKIIVLGLREYGGPKCVTFEEAVNSNRPIDLDFAQGPEATASLIYTSGTTAVPKGVLLTHKNICSNFLSLSKLNLFKAEDNILSVLPLHHAYPFMVNLVTPLLMGGTVTFSPAALRPQDLTGAIREADITLLAGVPQLFSLIQHAISERMDKIPAFITPFLSPFIKARIRREFGNLRFMVSGGARLEPELGRRLAKAGLKVTEGYGLTETSPVATFNPPEKIKFGSAGKPIAGVEVKINNPDKTGKGEILIKGPNVMKGYFKQPQLTSEVMKEGWFASGDLGYLDKDGYLFITGREKEVIILSSGKNIYPEELEAYYSQSPYIKEICILQRTERKGGFGIDSLFAVVVPNLEYCRQKEVNNIRTRIRWELEDLSKKLPAYQHIMGFVTTTKELARTPLNKLKRYQLKEEYLNNSGAKFEIKEDTALSEEDARLMNTAPAQKIIHHLQSRLKRPVSLDSHLEIDLGIDSLTQVELILDLEQLFSLELPDGFFADISTVKELAVKISGLAGGVGKVSVEAQTKEWSQILREPPKEKVLEKVRLDPTALDYFLVFIFKNLLLFIFRALWLLKIKNKEPLPGQGPYIISPNHASFLDAFVVFSGLPMRQALNTYFIGHNYIFEYPLVKWTIKLARLIPINPNTHLVDAMQAAAFLLSKGKIVCIFPEGERSISEQVGEFKKGVGILLKELDVPVVPVYIKGSHRSWPRGSLVPHLCPLQITFGRPISAQELSRQSSEPASDGYELIARGLREKVVNLSAEASFPLK